MEKGYAQLINDTNKKIKDIRCEAQAQITAVKNSALAEVEQDFALLGWNKFWTKEQLNNEWQFDQLEQSVTDKSLRMISLNEHLQRGIVDDRLGSYKVSGSECGCGAFVCNGLPCKHIYFLANALIELLNKDDPNTTH